MTFWKKQGYRVVVLSGAMAVTSLWAASESQAFFGFFQRRWDTAAAMYGGTTCGGPVTVNYVPQTCYRVQYCPAPVTTYRPVTSCDPCTGCPTTCLRPVTCYRLQPQYVPVASYRLQYSPLQPACAVPATTYYSSTAPAAVPAAGCGSCGVVPAAAYAPATSSTPAPQLPVTVQYAPSIGYPSSISIPSSVPYGYASPNATTFPSTTPPAATAPASSTPSYASPTYATPNYSTTPAPSLPANGTNDAGAYAPAAVPPLTPVPDLSRSTSAPAPQLSTTVPSTSSPTTSTSYYATPGYSSGLPAMRTPANPPYSSGVVGPTPAPALPQAAPSGTVPAATTPPTPAPRPIPDPELHREGPRLGPTSSTPRLIDPQDQTALAWPRRRTGGYVSIASVHAAVPATYAAESQRAAPSEAPVRLGLPLVAEPVATTSMPVRVHSASTVDVDGWRKSDR